MNFNDKQNFKIGLGLVRLLVGMVVVCAIFVLAQTTTMAASLNIARPVEGEKIKDIYSIQWSVFNTGQSSVPFEVRVKNGSCSDAGVSISGNNFLQTVTNGYQTLSWNTKNYSDGETCLQVCVLLDETDTAQCVQRRFEIINSSNNPPIITSGVPTKTYNTNDIFTHQVNAYDPDGDPITYQLLTAPDFLYINQNGQIALGNLMRVGSHRVEYAVIDKFGAARTDSFVLNVELAPTPQPTPVVSPTPTPGNFGETTPTPSDSSGDSNEDSSGSDSDNNSANTNDEAEDTDNSGSNSTNNDEEITEFEGNPEILFPRFGDTLNGLDNTILWEVDREKVSGSSSIVVSYQEAETTNLTEINKFTGNQANELDWNVVDIPNGEYEVVIEYQNSAGENVYKTISDTFTIANRQDEATILAIFGIKPENQSETAELSPTIEGNFAPSLNSEIVVNDVKIRLNRRNITKNCSITELGFECQVENELRVGPQNIEVTVADTSGQKLVQTWKFDVVEPQPQGSSAERPSSENQLNSMFDFAGFGEDFELTSFSLALLPYCGVLLLLLLMAYGIYWIRNRAISPGLYSKAKKEEKYKPIGAFDGGGSNAEPNKDYDFALGSFAVANNKPDYTPDSQPVNPQNPVNTASVADLKSKLASESQAEQAVVQQQLSDIQTKPATDKLDGISSGDSDVDSILNADDDLPDWLKGDLSGGSDPIGDLDFDLGDDFDLGGSKGDKADTNTKKEPKPAEAPKNNSADASPANNAFELTPSDD